MKCRSRMFSSLFALFLLVMTSYPALAAEHPATLSDVVSALEKGYATLQDVQADFSQRTLSFDWTWELRYPRAVMFCSIISRS